MCYLLKLRANISCSASAGFFLTPGLEQVSGVGFYEIQNLFNGEDRPTPDVRICHGILM
jgi:hypothetical protein